MREYISITISASIVLGVIGMILFFYSVRAQEDAEWQQKCKEAGGLPTLHLQYMTWHSETQRVCLHPSAVIQLEK